MMQRDPAPSTASGAAPTAAAPPLRSTREEVENPSRSGTQRPCGGPPTSQQPIRPTHEQHQHDLDTSVLRSTAHRKRSKEDVLWGSSSAVSASASPEKPSFATREKEHGNQQQEQRKNKLKRQQQQERSSPNKKQPPEGEVLPRHTTSTSRPTPSSSSTSGTTRGGKANGGRRSTSSPYGNSYTSTGATSLWDDFVAVCSFASGSCTCFSNALCAPFFLGDAQWHKAGARISSAEKTRRDNAKRSRSSGDGGLFSSSRISAGGTVGGRRAASASRPLDHMQLPPPASVTDMREFFTHFRQRSMFLLANGADATWRPEDFYPEERVSSRETEMLTEQRLSSGASGGGGGASVFVGEEVLDKEQRGGAGVDHGSRGNTNTGPVNEEALDDADFCADQASEFIRRIGDLSSTTAGGRSSLYSASSVKSASSSSIGQAAGVQLPVPSDGRPRIGSGGTETLVQTANHRSTASTTSSSSQMMKAASRATTANKSQLRDLDFDREYYGPYAHVPLLSDREGQEALMNFCTLMEGLQDGTSLLVFYFLKNAYDLSPVAISLSFAVTNLPWILKPLMAYTTDTVFVCGQRRKPFIVMANLLAAASYVAIGFTHSLPLSLFYLATAGFGRAFGLAAIQGFIVENSERDAASGPVSEFFWMRAVGSLLSSYLSGVLVGEHYNPAFLLSLLSTFPFLASTVAALGMIDDEPTETSFSTSTAIRIPDSEMNKVPSTPHQTNAMGQANKPIAKIHSKLFRKSARTLEDNWEALKHAVQTPMFVGPVIYLLCYCCGPNYDDALYYFYVNKLHFSPEFMGRMSLIHSAARLGGLAIYRWFGQSLSSRQLLATATLVSVPFYVVPSLITSGHWESLGFDSPRMLALGGEVVRDAFLYVQLMPALSAAAKVGPPGMEATTFSLVTALGNAGRGVQRITSAAVIHAFGVGVGEDYSGLTSLIFFCGGTLVLPLFILPYIQFADEVAEVGEEEHCLEDYCEAREEAKEGEQAKLAFGAESWKIGSGMLAPVVQA